MKKCPRCGKEYEDANTLCPADGAVLKETGDKLVGRTLAEKYRIEERISEGGMGTVYRATHVLMDKTVAIKILHASLAADDKIVARFSREARAASRISHPHALNVTDFGESEGVVFLVMEYLRGVTLKEAVHTDSPMSLPRVVEIMRQVTGALEAAHAEGVVHRDLKSDNIMLIDVGNNTGDWAKVLDFGIAKIQEPVGQDPALTAPNLIIGTPQYMSPEQCSQASEIDSRSDIYSLGIIIYEMLVGHVPFTGESPTAIMMKHLQEPPPSVLVERQDLPAEVGEVVERALAKNPDDRYQTASELSMSLMAAAEAQTKDAAVASSTSPNTGHPPTHRIVVPTGSNEPARHTAEQEIDEETLVRARAPRTTAVESEEFVSIAAPPPPPAERFNPWRIIVPAIAGLLVLFGVIYVISYRSSSAPTTNQGSPLTIDANSQPVQPAQPPTGQSEQNVTSNSAGANANANTSSTSKENQNADAPPADNKNADSGAGGQQDANANGQGEDTAPPPSNKNGNKNSNQSNEPPEPRTTPSQNSSGDDPPPPPPSDKKKRPPQATQPGGDAPPPQPRTSNTSEQ
jgi:serine/threonine protein kinase